MAIAGNTERALEPAVGQVLADWARRYRPVLANYFRRRLRGSADVEDLVQEVLLRLARQKDLGSIRLVEPYLFQTAASVLADYVRAGAVRRVQDHGAYDEEEHFTEVCSPEYVLERAQSVDRILRALRELPDRTRMIFVLRRWDGLANADIARMIGISVSAVEKHISRALVHLKECVGDAL